MEIRDYADNISTFSNAFVPILAVNNYLSNEVFDLKKTCLDSQVEIIDLKKSSINLQNENAKLQAALTTAETHIKYYEEQIQLARLRRFGKKSEVNPNQLSLFDGFEKIEVTNTPEAPIEIKTVPYARCHSHKGRRIDTTNLPRERIIHDLEPAKKICQCCGKELVKFGEDVSEQLEYIPASIKVIEHVRPKYTCQCKEAQTVKMAPNKESPIAKSLAGASLITEVIIKKYQHHLPLYRQSQIFLQEGVDIPDNTLGNWIMQAGELLLPLKKALWHEIENCHNLQVDETPVLLLSPNKQGYMWVYHSLEPQNRFAIFDYQNTRGSAAPNTHLAEYQGFLQNDGYIGYNALKHKTGIVPLGCFAHARRRFAEIVKISPGGKAQEALDLIGALYAIESEAKNFEKEARYKIRAEKSKPILDRIKKWLIETAATTPPKCALGEAIAYAQNQWLYLTNYVDYGETKIDNNLVENLIRPFALGRKNWLFIGNEKSANIASLIYGLIQTCKLNAINPRNYLIYILNQAHKLRRYQIEPKELLPQFIDKNLLT